MRSQSSVADNVVGDTLPSRCTRRSLEMERIASHKITLAIFNPPSGGLIEIWEGMPRYVELLAVQ